MSTLLMITDEQADRAKAKIRAVYQSIERPELGESKRVKADLEDIDISLQWLAEKGYSFDVEEWLADETSVNFVHDYAGILRHHHPSTGELVDCFIPRYARWPAEREK